MDLDWLCLDGRLVRASEATLPVREDPDSPPPSIADPSSCRSDVVDWPNARNEMRSDCVSVGWAWLSSRMFGRSSVPPMETWISNGARPAWRTSCVARSWSTGLLSGPVNRTDPRETLKRRPYNS